MNEIVNIGYGTTLPNVLKNHFFAVVEILSTSGILELLKTTDHFEN